MKLAYHGSLKKGLTELIFSPLHSKTKELHEGDGVYLAIDKDIAQDYAGEEGQVYTVDISDCSLLDATEESVFHTILEKVSQTYRLKNLLEVPFVSETIESVICGDSSISQFGQSIKLILENDENFITEIEKNGGYDFSETLAKEIQKEIDKFDGYQYFDRGIKNASALIIIIKAFDKIKIVD